MVDYSQGQSYQQLQTVDEESESDEMYHGDDVHSNSSTLKSHRHLAPRGSTERQTSYSRGNNVIMTESTDSGLESDKNVNSEQTTTQTDDSRRRRNSDNLVYHCQVRIFHSNARFTTSHHLGSRVNRQ